MHTIVDIEGLHYAYPPLVPGAVARPVLRGLSLSLRRGECLALLGATGAGKTTLCLTLNGIIPHILGGTLSGRVSVLGLNTRTERPGSLSEKVGLVFQEPESQLFTMTVADEVAFGPESLALPLGEIERRVDESLQAVGIPHLRTRSPLELSGGEKQRVALAAVLALEPEILVLDEPTASLDPQGTRSVLEAVSRLQSELDTTILWVTQDMDRVPLIADRVAVLSQGQILLDGTPREVFTRSDDLEALGLRVPQMAELASRFNQRWGTSHNWLTVDEAAASLGEANRG